MVESKLQLFSNLRTPALGVHSLDASRLCAAGGSIDSAGVQSSTNPGGRQDGRK